MQRVRAAFQLRLAEVLTQQHRLQCRATATHTDVLKVRLGQGGRLQGHQGLQDCVGRGLGPRDPSSSALQVLLPSLPFAASSPTGWVCV